MMGPLIAGLRFAGDFPPAVVFAVAGISAIAVSWLYLRETDQLASPYSYLLPSLRAAAVALVILILAGPVWHHRNVVGTLGRVIFAVDQSESMSMTDSSSADSDENRLQRANRILLGSGDTPGWLEKLKTTHDVDVISFGAGEPALLWSSRSEQPIPTSFEIQADADSSDLSVPVDYALTTLVEPDRDVADEQNQERLQQAALVVISDGRDNTGDSPLIGAKRLKGSAAIHALGFGSEDEPPDVGIVDIVRPESVAADGVLAGEIALKQFGMSGKPVRIRIESGGQSVWEREVSFSGDGQQTIPFELDVEPIVDAIRAESPRGVQRSTVVMDLRAAIEPIDGDYSETNNAMPFRIAASTRDRQVLILDGSSRWETRYLKNLFERDPAWTLETILFGPGTDMPELLRGDVPGKFPVSPEGLSKYDAIILGDIPGGQLRNSEIEMLRRFVSRGGGLIVIDGRYAQVRQLITQQFGDVVPIEYMQGSHQVAVKSFQPTRIGLQHPVMNLIGDRDKLEEFWKKIPMPKSVARVKPHPDAEVWGNFFTNGGQSIPWLVTRLFGSGRVLYLSSDQSWRWRYKVADEFHARFWNQVLAAAMQPPYSASDEFAALGTDKIEYAAGESSVIRARLLNPSGKPVADATVDALLVSDDRVVATVPLALDDPARGTYQGRTAALPPGAYRVRIRASGFDESALKASTPIWVGGKPSNEMRRVSLDADALAQIAEAGDGQYVHESSAQELLDQIRPLSSGTIVESDTVLWQTYYWFLLVIALLAVEWWLRKRAGLV